VQLGQNHLHRRHHLAVAHRHQVHGNAAPIIDNRDRVVHVDDDIDLLAIAGQRFVHGVVYDFVNKMVQSHLSGRANVHRGPQANRLKAL
jgi:hypothetical protein